MKLPRIPQCKRTVPEDDIPVAILVRVSTKVQDPSRQIAELQAVADAAKWHVVEVIREEGISGSSSIRPGLDRALELAEGRVIRKLLVHEVSRLSRSPAIAHGAIERLTKAGVSLYWHAQGVETLLPDGKRDPASGMMIAILAELARTEKETMIQRIKSGIAEARRKGRKMGRPKGTTLGAAELVAKHADIVRHLEKGKPMRDVAKLTGKALGTVLAVSKAMERKGKREPGEKRG